MLWAVAASLGLLAAAQPAGLEAKLQEIAHNESLKWNCSYSISFYSPQGTVSVAAGIIDGHERAAQPSDKYAWGSVTKVLTGVSILRLVSEGMFTLDDEAAPLVDPMLAKMAKANPNQGFSSMEELWGAENVSGTTVRNLLHMTSGVPDFDTAKPCGRHHGHAPCTPTDSLRDLLYSEPSVAYSPTELMKVPWVAHQWQSCKSWRPGMSAFCYSSTNFMLLGLILASKTNASTWSSFDQSIFLPESLASQLQFGVTGSPSNFTEVHGFDRTAYNMPPGETNNHDDWQVDGVFSGWTASDLVASSAAIAEMIYEVYGPRGNIAPPALVKQMVPNDSEMYGLATFNLTHMTGQHGRYGAAYGHLGATYGYQSVVAYFPGLDFSLAVATNMETDNQQQPADAMCYSYNAIASKLLGQELICNFTSGSYYGGGCKCSPISDSAPPGVQRPSFAGWVPPVAIGGAALVVGAAAAVLFNRKTCGKQARDQEIDLSSPLKV